MKVCGRCKVEKELSEFHRRSSFENRHGIGAYKSICKQCKSKLMAIYYQQHQDKLKKYSSEYAKSNREKVNSYIRERWRQSCSGRISTKNSRKKIMINISDEYIRHSLLRRKKDLVPTALLDVIRESIKLKRYIKEIEE